MRRVTQAMPPDGAFDPTARLIGPWSCAKRSPVPSRRATSPAAGSGVPSLGAAGQKARDRVKSWTRVPAGCHAETELIQRIIMRAHTFDLVVTGTGSDGATAASLYRFAG